MSARFGRNKRRKAREQIAALAQSLDNTRAAMALDRELTAHIQRELGGLRDEVELAKDIAWPYSALFEPEKLLAAEVPFGEPVDVDCPPRLDLCAPIDAAGAEYLTFTRLPLHAVIESVNYDAMNGMVHAIVEYKGGSIAYALSDRTLAGMSKRTMREFMQKHVAPMLVRGLTEKLMPLVGRK